MHALHMPHRLLWRAALLALLPVLAMTLAVTEVNGLELPSLAGDDGSAPATTPIEPSTERPAWLNDPLRDPVLDFYR